MLAEINHKTQPSAVQIPCTASPSVGMYEPMHEREKKKNSIYKHGLEGQLHKAFIFGGIIAIKTPPL